jgi:hypothetical protein
MAKSYLKDHCKDQVGKVYPVVDFSSCGGKEFGIAFCPTIRCLKPSPSKETTDLK